MRQNASYRLEVLARRAAALSRPLHTDTRSEQQVEIALCHVGDELIGFPVENLREIVPIPKVTRLPNVPAWYLGIAQVRGSLLGVVDFGEFYEVKGGSTATHVAVLESPTGLMAFTVDQVVCCRHVIPLSFQPNAAERIERSATLGVTADLIVVIDVPRLLALPELMVG